MKKGLMIGGLLALTALAIGARGVQGESASRIAVVNLANCAAESKMGKQEQGAFDTLKKQMTTLLENTETEIREITNQLNDEDFRDGLSPEGEDQLKMKYQAKSEEYSRYQNQYYQVLQQANMRIMQTLHASIATASEKVRKDKKLAMVLNKDALFSYAPQLDMTDIIIEQMNHDFDFEQQNPAQISQEQSMSSDEASSQ